MTWVKQSDDYADGCVHLSDAAYRTHNEALLWVMRHEAGPRFDKRLLRRIASTKNPEAAVRELVAVGFVKDCGDEYEVIYHMEHQAEPDVIAKRKAMHIERQRRYLRNRAGLPDQSADGGQDA